MQKSKRSTRRKICNITNYKEEDDSELFISDSDDKINEIKHFKKKVNKENSILSDVKNCESWKQFHSGFDGHIEAYPEDNIIIASDNEENKNPNLCTDEINKIEAFSSSDVEVHSDRISTHGEPEISQVSSSSNTEKTLLSAGICSRLSLFGDHEDDISPPSTPQLFESTIKSESEFNLTGKENETKDLSASISPPSSPLHHRDKGSNWLSTIHWKPKTPCNQRTPALDPDSGKKKKKYINGGFAEQLVKFQTKQQSSKIFWNHEKCHLENPQQGKSPLLLQLIEFRSCNGMIISRCKLYSSKTCTVNKESASSDNSRNHLNTEISHSFNKTSLNFGKCIVLFDLNHFEKLYVTPGVYIQLFPPWQELSISNGNILVILCTYFVNILNSGQLICEDISSKANQDDQKIDDENCHSTETKQELTGSECKEVSAGSFHLLDNHNGNILSAVDLSVDWQEIVICVRVHRICRKVFSSEFVSAIDKKLPDKIFVKDSEMRSFLLTQDVEGSFCELHLPSNALESDIYEEIITSGIGKTYWFLNIQMSQRLNSSRNPNIFSLLRSISSRQSSSGHLPKEEENLYARSFCYIFKANFNSTAKEELTKQLPPFVPPLPQPISNIVNDPLLNERCTFVARIICKWNRRLFLTDTSLMSCNAERKKYIQVFIHPDCFLPPVLTNSHTTCTISVIDSTMTNGIFSADSYTSIIIEDPPSVSHNHYFITNHSTIEDLKKIQLYDACEKLSKDVEIGDLVNINGYITGVDEQTSFSWMECIQCESFHLVQDNLGRMCCDDCHAVSYTSVMRYSMEIFLIDFIKQEMKIKLLDSTIKSILSPSKDEPCNVDILLGLPLGPIACCVAGQQHYSKTNSDMLLLEEIHLYNDHSV